MKVNKDYLLLAGYFVISRALMVMMGFRIHVDYSFMHFHDIEWLKDNFWETILYTHAFTPWINLLTGFVIRFPENTHIPIYQLTFYTMSIIALLSFYRILTRFHIAKYTSMALAILFTLTPPYIYMEHFLGYSFPSMVMLLLIINSLDRALKQRSFLEWLIFFSLSAYLCFIRTTFHFVWIIAVLVGVLLLVKKLDLKILLASIFPLGILTLWNLKNWIIFGFFGASSWSGFNLAFNTTQTLNEQEKELLISQNVLSPIAAIPIYSGIETYSGYTNLNEKHGVNVLDQVNKPSQDNSFNYNHAAFVKLSSLKMKDNLSFLKRFPFRYLKRVVASHVQYFGPTTRWHPHDQLYSPHIPLRNKMEWWENLHNNLVHFAPSLKSVGIYLIVVWILAYYFIQTIISFFKWKKFDHRHILIAFLIMNIFYVTFLSCLVTYGELSRYRFMIEPFIWILTIYFVQKSTSQLNYFKKLSGVFKKGTTS